MTDAASPASGAPAQAGPDAHSTNSDPSKTALYDAHVRLGARMVPFAGYLMPVQYEGILAEHQWTRAHAGLFDVSHMGQATLISPDFETTARALEALVPADILSLKPGQQRYSQLLNDTGGILDDLMVSRSPDPKDEGRLILVVNAGRKYDDIAHVAARLPAGVTLEPHPRLALIALQGPEAVAVLARLAPAVADMPFMTGIRIVLPLSPASRPTVYITRSGYTGEDGFEISIPADHVAALWDHLAAEPEVKPIGLGARDSLRLEAGLCLYGHDIDETTSPVEAGLLWSIQRRRREDGGFPGAARIQSEIARRPARRRVGIRPEGRAPAREGTEIHDAAGRPIGIVTSGGFGPSVGAPIAMGYVEAASAAPGTAVQLLVRGKPLPAVVAALPFVPNRFHRSPK
jgi:aminomethyltransferase